MINKSSLTKNYYKVGEVGKMCGRTARSIQNYCMSGKIKNDFLPSGKRIIPLSEVIKFLDSVGILYDDTNNSRYDILYARVSTSKQKTRGDLERQRMKIVENIVSKNPTNLKSYCEVGSGLNDKRKLLGDIMNKVMNNEVNRIFILYKDRLTRFGFNYLESICKHFGTEIIIISEDIKDKSMEEELAEDIVSIIHSVSGKLYGMGRKIKDEVDKIGDLK